MLNYRISVRHVAKISIMEAFALTVASSKTKERFCFGGPSRTTVSKGHQYFLQLFNKDSLE